MSASKKQRLAAAGSAAVLILLFGRLVVQNRLLYFPEKAVVAEVAGGNLRAWPSALDFRGLEAEPPRPARAVALVFHGNAGHAGHRSFYASALAPLGVHVILAEYPGYGPRGGTLGEEALVADGVASLDLARAHYPEPILVVGESLGAAVAAQVSVRRPAAAAGLWLLTPWDRLVSVARHHYPWLPVSWFLRDRYDTAARLSAFESPVLVDVAERDEIVPPALGKGLFDSLPSPKRLRVIPGARHNDWPDRVDAAWWRQAVDFLLNPTAHLD